MSQTKRALSVDQIFAYRLRDARLSKQWKQQDLADAMARVGYPINRATIAKIEAGARGVGGGHGLAPIKRGQTAPRPVSLEEAIAFAVALDVPASSLFLPIVREDDVYLTPGSGSMWKPHMPGPAANGRWTRTTLSSTASRPSPDDQRPSRPSKRSEYVSSMRSPRTRTERRGRVSVRVLE